MVADKHPSTVKSGKALQLTANLHSLFRTATLACCLAILCYIAAYVTGMLTVGPERLAPLWPGCALLLAVLLRQPTKLWPLLIAVGLVGFVVYDLRIGLSFRSIILLVLADTVELLIAGLVVRYSLRELSSLDSLNSLARYSLFAVILAPICGAFLGAAAFGRFYWANWRSSFLTEALALLTVTPAILSWLESRPRSPRRLRPAYFLEMGILGLSLVFLGYFTLIYSGSSNWPGLQYTILPFLLWAALGFGIRGISTSMIVLAFQSIWGATHGRGPFTGPDPIHNVLSLQLFLIFSATPFMILAVFVEERERTHETLLSLTCRLIGAHEQERSRIARELHDDICQRLAMLSLKIEKVSKGWGHEQLSVPDQLDQIWQQCSKLTGDVQALSHELHPSVLENLGLAIAVKRYCREISEQNGVLVEFSGGNLPGSLPLEVSLSLFRVVQEALRNAVKYSGQKRFEVRLQESTGQLELDVSDQGVGFDLTKVKNGGGLGLVSMAERIHQVNGTFSIESHPNAGTRIRACVPLGAQSTARSAAVN